MHQLKKKMATLLDYTNDDHNVLLVVTLSDLTDLLKSVVQNYMSEKESEKKENDHLLSAADSAKLLKVSLPTLWRWGKCGYIQPVKLGKHVCYKKSEIEKIMNNGVCTHQESSKTVKF